MNKKNLILLTFFGILCSFTTWSKAQNADRELINALTEAVRQSQKPTDNMKISFARQDVNPLYAKMQSKDISTPLEQVYQKTEYTVYISGLRSRLEKHAEMFQGDDSQPYGIKNEANVFDGKRQRKLTDRTFGDKLSTTGSQSLQDKNTSRLASLIDKCYVNFRNPDIQNQHNFELVGQEAPGIYVLDNIQSDGFRTRLTIDANRGYNIIKVEDINENNKILQEINTTLKQYPNGIWYPEKREVINFTVDGKPITDHIITFTEVVFDAEIPEEKFTLEFPDGIYVWDDILNDRFLVGAPDSSLVNANLLDLQIQSDPAQNNADRQFDLNPTSENDQIRDLIPPPFPAAMQEEQSLPKSTLLGVGIGLVALLLVLAGIVAIRKKSSIK